jgi:SAM-dependent methyltransferase
VERPDLARAFPSIPHAGFGGFVLVCCAQKVQSGDPVVMELALEGEKGPIGSKRLLVSLPWPDPFPLPPQELRQRIMGHLVSEALFQTGGLGLVGSFLGAALEHLADRPLRRILDWGCGCGRLARFLFALEPGLWKTYGADIDREAVLWCHLFLAQGRFLPISTEPPTPYPEGFFDLVLASSVFTHLAAEEQARWLAELARILAPGGLLVASTQGELAASLSLSREECVLLEQKGIWDAQSDSALAGVAPERYYRIVYQTQVFTQTHWKERFRLLDYRPGAAGHFQDLVVLQKQA